jgi:hypothetical protein
MGKRKVSYCSRTCLGRDQIAGMNSHRIWKNSNYRLPKTGQWVLIWRKGIIHMSVYDGKDFRYWPLMVHDISLYEKTDIYWMSLPRPPLEFRKKNKKSC